MLISMLIEVSRSTRMVLPSTAVVRENDVDHVFIAEPEECHRLAPVGLGAGARRAARGAFRPKGQERVVIDGAFHLNNERRQALEAK